MDKPKAGPSSEQLHLPAGFRFHPTDEELVVHYLAYKAESRPFPIPIIAEVDLYKFDPWELPEKALFGEREWYFFSPRDRKYPNGARPNRAAASGYWKATGTDKPILSKGKKVGVKKALVFYKGRAPKGVKTNWIMHEYRLADSKAPLVPARRKGSLRLDDWVLCRIYKKSSGAFKVMVSAPNMAVKAEPEEDLEDVLASLPDIDAGDDSRFRIPQWGGGGGGGNFATSFMPSDQQMIQELFSDEQDTSENASGSFDQAMSYPSSLTNHEAGYSQDGLPNQMVMMNKLNSWAYDTQFPAATTAAPPTPRSFKVVNPPPIKLERVPSNISEILLQIQNSKKRLRVDDEDDVQSTCRSPVPRPKQGFGFMDFSTGSHQMLF